MDLSEEHFVLEASVHLSYVGTIHFEESVALSKPNIFLHIELTYPQ